MSRNDIISNFLPLNCQNFQFNIWAKPWAGAKTTEYGKQYRISIGDKAPANYEILIPNDSSPEHGFESFSISSKGNEHLTNRFLFEKLVENANKAKAKGQLDFEVWWGFDRHIFVQLELTPRGRRGLAFRPEYIEKACKFGLLIDFSFRKSPEIHFSREVLIDSLALDKSGKANKQFYEDKFKWAKRFSEISGKLLPISTGTEVISMESEFITMPCAELASRSVEVGGGAKAADPFQALRKNGPFQKIPRDVNFVVAFKEQNHELARHIWSALQGNVFKREFPGFQSFFKFKIENARVSHVTLDNYEKAQAERIATHIANIKANTNDITIVLIVEDRENVEEEGSNFYYELKALSLAGGFLVQFLDAEKMRNDETLKWAASSIALQIFAKLGGIPWRIPTTRETLVIGIGNSFVRDESGTITRFYAHSVCMSTDGLIRDVELLGEAEQEADLSVQLSRTLKTKISEYKSQGFTSISVHVPFKLNKDLISAIKNVVRQEAGDKCSVLILKINEDSKYFGWADTAGKAPSLGTYVHISERESLLWIDGIELGGTSQKRIGKPVHIQLLFDTTGKYEVNRMLALEDIYYLSGANWRGFRPKKSATTIYFPRLLADFYAEFDRRGLNVSNSKMDRGLPWFL
jgi:hypothetical protein